MNNCPDCRSALVKETEDKTYGKVIVKNVPVEKCTFCGKTYIACDFQHMIDDIIDKNHESKEDKIYTFVTEKKGNNVKTYIKEYCPFCDHKNIIKLRILRLGTMNVILNSLPITEGHLLITPDRHVKSLNELDRIEKIELTSAMSNASFVAEKVFSEDMVIFFNKGKQAGQTVDHFHVHIVPRSEGDNFINPGRKNGKKIPISDDDIKKLKGRYKV